MNAGMSQHPCFTILCGSFIQILWHSKWNFRTSLNLQMISEICGAKLNPVWVFQMRMLRPWLWALLPWSLWLWRPSISWRSCCTDCRWSMMNQLARMIQCLLESLRPALRLGGCPALDVLLLLEVAIGLPDIEKYWTAWFSPLFPSPSIPKYLCSQIKHIPSKAIPRLSWQLKTCKTKSPRMWGSVLFAGLEWDLFR